MPAETAIRLDGEPATAASMKENSAGSSRRSWIILYGSVVAAMAVVVLSAILTATYLRQLAYGKATESTQNLANSIEQTFEGMIDTIDVALLTSTDEIVRQLSNGKIDSQSITAMLIRQQQRIRIVDNIRASNERGEAVYGPDALSPPVNISDRDHFIRLRDDPNAGLFISKPIVGRHKDRWVWTFARRFNKPDGSFGGVVYASAMIDEIERNIAHIRNQPGASVALRNSDLGLITHYSFGRANPFSVGDKRISTPFEQALKVNPREGTYISDLTSVDPIIRIHSYRRSPKYGFLVNVGVETEAALADWRKQIEIIAGMVVAFALASLAYLAAVSRAWRHQKRNLAALEASDERFRSLTEISSDYYWETDSVHRVSQTDFFDRRVFHLKHPHIGMRRWELESLSPDAAGWEAHRIVLDSHQPFRNFEFSRYSADGVQRHFSISGVPVFDASGAFTGYRGVGIDATERKLIESERRESASRLSALFEANPMAIVVSRVADGKILEANDAALRLYGHRRHETIGRGVGELGVYTNPSQRETMVQLLRAQGKIDNFSLDVRLSGGAMGVVELSGRLIELQGEECLVAMMIDVTDRKRSENELVSSKKAAEEANLAKSRFLASASHDLRQPIQAINLFSMALANTALSAEQKKISDYLALSAKSLGNLLNVLLDISKFDAGLVKPARELIDTGALIRNVVAEVALLASEKRLRLRAFPRREVLVSFADAKLLRSLLGNLVDNAIKYTERGGVLVGTRRLGRQILIQVWDTGIGIAPEHVDNIFEEYFQVGNPERDRTKGLGLGLAIAKRIAGLLETELVCRSRLGRGSVFEFRLPLADEPREQLPGRIQQKDINGDGNGGLSGRRIVVIEDDSTVAVALRLSLESQGMSVTIYHNAEDALANPGITEADFYVSDLRLPGLNGREFLDVLQTRSQKRIKGVILTGDTSPERVELAKTSRWTVMFKPVDLPTLLSAISSQGTVR
jgi:PAS domain S-box-containing protein